MNIIDRLLAEQPKEDALLQEWQFQISKWILNVMEERRMTQRDIARIVRMTEPQISALIHCDTNATLATLARLSALLGVELMSIARPSLRSLEELLPTNTSSGTDTAQPNAASNSIAG